MTGCAYHSLTVPQVDLSLTYENDVEFQMET